MSTSDSSVTGPVTAAKKYFPELNGLRAVAALSVFLHHTTPDLSFLPPILSTLLLVPGTGVIAFFVVSGFLLAYQHTSDAGIFNSGYKPYLVKRFVRVYPLYLLLTLIILLWQRADIFWHWILNITLLQSFFDTNLAGIRQAWSLSVQEIFYLTAPALFIGFAKFPGRFISAVLAVGSGLVLLSQYLNWQPFMPSIFFMLEATFFGYIFSFFCGYQLARYLKKHTLSPHSGSRVFKYYTFAGLVLTLFCMYLAGSAKPITTSYLGNISPVVLLGLINIIYPICLAILLFGLLRETTVLSRLLASGLAQVLGRSSYAFYLLHTGLFFEAIYFHISKNLLVIFLTLTVISIGVYYLFEKPVYLYLRQRWLR